MSLLAALCVLVAAGSALAASETSSQTRPQLGVAGKSPLRINGVGFDANERVHVLLALNGRQRSRITVAGANGAFSVAFPVSLGRCTRFAVQAFGSTGSRARVMPTRPAPDCMSPAAGDTRT
jgi:hypothetical protein